MLNFVALWGNKVLSVCYEVMKQARRPPAKAYRASNSWLGRTHKLDNAGAGAWILDARWL